MRVLSRSFKGLGFRVTGSFKGVNIGALIIRIRFGAHSIIVVMREPQNSIGPYGLNYIGLHIMIYAIFLN